MKCNRCNLPIDRDDAFVTMPNREQCGYKARRPTAFAHARCFERDIKSTYKQELKDRAALLKEIDADDAVNLDGRRAIS